MKAIPFNIHLGKGDNAFEKGEEFARAIIEKAKELGVPEEARSVLQAKLQGELEKVRRDGPGLTTARSLVELLKDAEKTLEVLPEGMVSLAKLVKPKANASVYALGGIGSDIETATGLLQAARSRLREIMDADPWVKDEPKPEPKPESKPAEAQPGAE